MVWAQQCTSELTFPVALHASAGEHNLTVEEQTFHPDYGFVTTRKYQNANQGTPMVNFVSLHTRNIVTEPSTVLAVSNEPRRNFTSASYQQLRS